ncbi:hypothetical protein KCU77_g16966, partial [Aureobasidium melanogenum]
MGPQPQTKTEAANAITILRSSFHSSAEAVSKLEQYIRHLEELLLEELGREEFERRLEHLILRDQRNEESLFIPDDNPICRKRGSSSTEVVPSPKKARSDSLVSSLSGASGLGRSILEGGRRLHSDSPDVSPKTSRKTSVLEVPVMDAQQKPTTVKQMARRPIVAPRSRPSRGSQSAMTKLDTICIETHHHDACAPKQTRLCISARLYFFFDPEAIIPIEQDTIFVF